MGHKKHTRTKQRYHPSRPQASPQTTGTMEEDIEYLIKALQRGPAITGAPPVPKVAPRGRPTRAQIHKYKRAVGRKRKRGRRKAGRELAPKEKYQMQQLKAVSRRGQPQAIIRVPKMVERADMGGMVSSSWIAAIYWYAEDRVAYMVLLNGYEYEVYIPFVVLERWYWAHSKGTFFNGNIKGKYRVVRVK